MDERSRVQRLTTPDRVLLLLSLVPYLREHGPTPVSDLARTFGVEERMIRRLVRFLGTAGVPGETQSYQHEDLFDIDWDAFEEHDVVALTQIVAVDDTPRFSTAESATLIAGLHALTPMLPGQMREAAASAAAKLSSLRSIDSGDATISVAAEAFDSRLGAITAAIDAGTRLTFEYRDAAGRRTRRTVDPLLLQQLGDAWYLRAHCEDRGEQRSFLVDRIREPQVLDTPAEPRTEPPRPGAIVDIARATVTATLSVRRDALHRIADFAPRIIGEPKPGWVRAEIEMLHPAVAARLVQAAPGLLVIEGPSAARAAVLDWVDRALAHYDG